MVPVNECVLTDTPADRQKMRMGKVRIVQVMHSLRLLSLVLHTMAPMHSLSTLSHINKKKTHKLLLHRGGRREENGEGVAVCTANVPSGGRQLTLSADVNGLDVCNKAKRAIECPQLANKKMTVNKNTKR